MFAKSKVVLTLIGLGLSSAVLADRSMYGEGSSWTRFNSPPLAAAKQSIYDVAKSNPNFSTLAAAIEAAGLQDTLRGDGPFTVYAPTNDAFAKIPPAQLNALIADKAKLQQILTYHVVPGKVMAADKRSGQQLSTVQGGKLAVSTGKSVKVGNAQIKATDVLASNGIIHTIDTVLIPN